MASSAMSRDGLVCRIAVTICCTMILRPDASTASMPSRRPSRTASIASAGVRPSSRCCSGAQRASPYTTPSAARSSTNSRATRRRFSWRLHDGDGVAEGLEVALQRAGGGLVDEPLAELLGGRGGQLVPDVAGQFEDGGRPQARRPDDHAATPSARLAGRPGPHVTGSVPPPAARAPGPRTRTPSAAAHASMSARPGCRRPGRVHHAPTAAAGTDHTAASTSPRAFAQLTATSRPPPVAASCDTTPHSAHSVTPYAAFSTLHPTTTRPSSTSPAAPTGNVNTARTPDTSSPAPYPEAPPNRPQPPKPLPYRASAPSRWLGAGNCGEQPSVPSVWVHVARPADAGAHRRPTGAT